MLRFFCSSLIAAIVDFLLIFLLNEIMNLLDLKASQIVARAISGTMNFYLNKTMVYKSHDPWLPEFFKYIPLCLANLLIEVLLLKPLKDSVNGHLLLAYIVMKVILLIAPYLVQGKLVYRIRKNNPETDQSSK